MGTKKEELESTTGCLAKVADDEPIFVLRAQDKLAPKIVREWASRLDTTLITAERPIDAAARRRTTCKVEEARALADRMEAWQREHGCKVPD